MIYQVVYVWRGERHVHSRQGGEDEMRGIMLDMRRNGWQAWTEPVM